MPRLPVRLKWGVSSQLGERPMDAHETQSIAAVALFLVCFVVGGAVVGEVRTGGFEAVFTERWPHSSVRHVLRRMQQELPAGSAAGLDYRIDEQTYSVYVPSDYSGDVPYGLVVWVSSGEKGDMPEGWSALMDKHKLIWIGAHRSGNEHNL